MTKVQKDKVNLANDINVILRWALEENEDKKIKSKVSKVLRHHNVVWYESPALIERCLLRKSLLEVTRIRDELLEAIY